MARVITRSQILNLDPADYDQDVRDRAPVDMLPPLRYFLQEGESMLPSQNKSVEVEHLTELCATLAAFRDKIDSIQRNDVISGFQNYTFDDSDIVSGRLTFSAIGVSLRPRRASEFIVTKGGADLVSSDPFTRFSGDAILVPGVGIDFVDSWEAGQKGILQVFSGALASTIRVYLYRASQFSGVEHKVANLGTIGIDQYGQSIAKLPTSANQVVVRVGGTYRYLIDDYTFTTVNGSPVITFLDDLIADQSVVFTIFA